MLFCSDPHGAFAYILDAAKIFPASLVILLGDLELRWSMDHELEEIANRVWSIPGNHDADAPALWMRMVDSKMSRRNGHGRVAKLLGGVRLAGLGGIFQSTIWHPHPNPQVNVEAHFRSLREHGQSTPTDERWRGGPQIQNHAAIYPRDFDRLWAQRADVLITHEAPGYHPHGFERLSDLARKLGVRFTVRGLHHDCIDSSAAWGAQRFKSFGVGLRGITAIDAEGNAETVIRGELDDLLLQLGLGQLPSN